MEQHEEHHQERIETEERIETRTETPAAPHRRGTIKTILRVLMAIVLVLVLIAGARWIHLRANGTKIGAPPVAAAYDHPADSVIKMVVEADKEWQAIGEFSSGQCVRVEVDRSARWEWHNAANPGDTINPVDRNVTAVGGVTTPLGLDAVRRAPSLASEFYAPQTPLGALLIRINGQIKPVGYEVRECLTTDGAIELVQNRQIDVGHRIASGAIPVTVKVLKNP